MGHCFISFKIEDVPVCLHIDGTGLVEGKGAGERSLGERQWVSQRLPLDVNVVRRWH